MSPVTHFLIGWSVANMSNLSRKERMIATFVGILPDIDGAGILLDFFGTHKGLYLEWWGKYHHVLGHNIGFGLFLTIAAFALSTRRWILSFLVMVSFHLHLIGDLLGSKGPDGYQWPIPYLLPFSDAWQWQWAGQWQLNAWQNFVITGIVTWHMFYLAWKNEVSPLEIISSKANTSFVGTLQRRFGIPKGKSL
jgi:hypothetical protein